MSDEKFQTLYDTVMCMAQQMEGHTKRLDQINGSVQKHDKRLTIIEGQHIADEAEKKTVMKIKNWLSWIIALLASAAALADKIFT